MAGGALDEGREQLFLSEVVHWEVLLILNIYS